MTPVMRPQTEDELSAALREASRGGYRVAVVGGGRQRALWPQPGAEVSRLETTALPAPVAVNPANLTVRAAAGLTLRALQEALAEHGLWYPTAWADTGASTVGGHVAAATLGTRRSDGGVRDRVLGVRAVLADGRAVRAGGEMIKNVAGYDLTHLFAGSYGTLGVLVEVALRVVPRPRRVATLAIGFERVEAASQATRPLLRQLEGPVAVEVLPAPGAGGWQLLTRWEGDAADVQEAVAGFARQVRDGSPQEPLWDGEAEAPWRSRDRHLSTLAADGALHLELIAPLSATMTAWRRCAELFADLPWFGSLQPTAGVLHLALPSPTPKAALSDLGRAAADAGGHLRVRTLPPWCRDRLPPPADAAARLHAAVRTALDPAGIFAGPGLPLASAGGQGGFSA